MHAAITFPRRRHIQLSCDIDEESNICVSSSQGCLSDGCTAAVRLSSSFAINRCSLYVWPVLDMYSYSEH